MRSNFPSCAWVGLGVVDDAMQNISCQAAGTSSFELVAICSQTTNRCDCCRAFILIKRELVEGRATSGWKVEYPDIFFEYILRRITCGNFWLIRPIGRRFEWFRAIFFNFLDILCFPETQTGQNQRLLYLKIIFCFNNNRNYQFRHCQFNLYLSKNIK